MCSMKSLIKLIRGSLCKRIGAPLLAVHLFICYLTVIVVLQVTAVPSAPTVLML